MGPGGVNKPDTVALTTVGRSGHFDDFHVWAPHIVQLGPTFYMFYTGVHRDGVGQPQHQRIGIATYTPSSSDLNLQHWQPASDPILTALDVPWAKKDLSGTKYAGAQQLRDPFVMEDPVHSGKWLMYFVAVDSLSSTLTNPRMAVGVARSDRLFGGTWTADLQPIRRTQDPTSDGETKVVESPHVFRRHGQWWLPYTVSDNVYFIATTQADPADTVAAHWSTPIWLRGAAEGQPEELRYWHATEYLRLNTKEYLAAFNDNDISLQISGVSEAANPAADSLALGCPEVAGVGERHNGNAYRLEVLANRARSSEVRLRLALPSPGHVHLAIYDVAGRMRASLIDRDLLEGVTEVTWRGRDGDGIPVASGVYFARATARNGPRMAKLVILR